METDGRMFKLTKLDKETDYIQLKQRAKAYLRKYDYSQVSLTDLPAVTSNFLQD